MSSLSIRVFLSNFSHIQSAKRMKDWWYLPDFQGIPISFSIDESLATWYLTTKTSEFQLRIQILKFRRDKHWAFTIGFYAARIFWWVLMPITWCSLVKRLRNLSMQTSSTTWMSLDGIYSTNQNCSFSSCKLVSVVSFDSAYPLSWSMINVSVMTSHRLRQSISCVKNSHKKSNE